MNSKRKMVGTLTLGALVGTLGVASIANAATNCAKPAGDTADPVNSPAPTDAVVLLLDRSGSMYYNGNCNGVKRKWECAVADVNAWVGQNDPFGDRVYFIWQFMTKGDVNVMTVQNNGPNGNGFCKADALALLDTTDLPGPTMDDASTPLAGAYCQSVEFLQSWAPSHGLASINLDIKLESDGLENSTPTDPSITKCFGDTGGTTNFQPTQNPAQPIITATTADGLVLGSWESKMYDAAISGHGHLYPPLDPLAFKRPVADFEPKAVTTNVTFLDEFIPSTALRLAPRVGPDSFANAGLAALAAASGATLSSDDELVSFYGKWVQANGGRLVRMGLGTAPTAGDPYGFHLVAGDANDSGCVDTADFTLVKNAYGQKAVTGNANAIRSDLNTDGIVNSSDYLVLRANYGKGCTTPPGPVPVLSKTLFGFEDPSAWSSLAPLAGTATKHTEGLYSLKVGGGGWREIKSVAFNTSLFSGITSKIGVDVLIPAKVSNPAWLGQVLLFVNSPSAGLNNVPLGSAELGGKPLNKFSTVQFNLPTNVKNAMSTPRADFSFKIVVNANDAGYEIDNLRFQ